LSPSQSFPGCTTNMSGYDFRKAQVGLDGSGSPIREHADEVVKLPRAHFV
jgi:hypothetical protein